MNRIWLLSSILFALAFLQSQGQTCSCDGYGPELVSNGDFSLGNTGFTTGYVFSTIAAPGRYGITTNAYNANIHWAHCTDHTSGNGNFMWVDGSDTSSLNMWTEVISNLNPNKDYLFSCWLNTLDPTAPAILQFSVNGQLIDSPFTAPPTTCNWAQFCVIWNSGTNTSATITITNQSQYTYGNDLGIDDISFRECCHTTSQNAVASVCGGDSYQLPGGNLVSVSGIYSDTLTSYLGCDSVIVTDLSVLPNSSHSQNISICSGQSFYTGGGFQTTSGTYTDTLANYLGCDSVITTLLTVLPGSSFTVSASICQGQSFYAGGNFQTTTGNYFDTLINYLGCDSVITTQLTVLPKTFFTANISICAGQSYFAGGALQTTSGIYLDTFVNYLGCDSILTTNLTVLPNTSFTTNVFICNGQTYFAGGALQATSGVYLDTLVNYLGCDSVLTTNITVLPNSSSTLNVSICDGQSYFAGGALQTTSGVYPDTLVNYLGCDSVLTTNLTVLPNSSSTLNVSICNGQSYFAGGAFETVTGVYLDTFVNSLGCDSVLTTNLTVLSNSTFNVNVSICNGQSYLAGGALQTMSGVYLDTFINSIGCDSILTTNLTVLPNTSFTIHASICEGQSYFAGGNFQTASGIYLDTLINSFGCDSVVTTQLTVLPNSSSTANASICDGQSYYAGGALQTTTGIYFDTLVNALGCDSVITTNLNVLPNSAFTQEISICPGDSMYIAGGWHTQAGIYVDQYTNYLGCDSTVTTHLTLLPVLNTQVNAAICAGESYYAGGGNQTQTGVYVDTLTAITGCDSIVTTDLIVLAPISMNVYRSICDGDQYMAGGGWQTVAGIYVDTLSSFSGCDSAVITHLTVNPDPVINLGDDITLCDGSSVVINAGNEFQTYLWQDQSTQSSILVKDVGTYWVMVTNSFGCSASDTLQVTNVFPLPDHFLIPDTTICGNIPLTIEVPGFEKYLWWNGDTTSYMTFTDQGHYNLTVADAHGCIGSNTVVIENGCDKDMLVPNAFTPNNDGLNDVFLPIIVNNLSDYDMKIFNRWGKMIFESDDSSVGWDGSDEGVKAEIGSYSWIMTYTLESGTRKVMSGYVTLLR